MVFSPTDATPPESRGNISPLAPGVGFVGGFILVGIFAVLLCPAPAIGPNVEQPLLAPYIQFGYDIGGKFGAYAAQLSVVICFLLLLSIICARLSGSVLLGVALALLTLASGNHGGEDIVRGFFNAGNTAFSPSGLYQIGFLVGLLFLAIYSLELASPVFTILLSILLVGVSSVGICLHVGPGVIALPLALLISRRWRVMQGVSDITPIYRIKLGLNLLQSRLLRILASSPLGVSWLLLCILIVLFVHRVRGMG